MSKTGIFAGLRVLDAASWIAAPAAATIMADFGADVIKIEPPGGGDGYRNLSFQPGMPESGTDYCWTIDNRNKRDLALDLKDREAQKILHGLVTGADVFITNYPPAVRRRLGIAFDQLNHLNARLVYASLTAYGEHGEEAGKPGFDATAWWARSGLMHEVRPDAASLPARSLPGMGDHPTALAVYGAIATALFRRERTGKGAYVGTSLLASGAWAGACFVQAGLDGARFHPRPSRTEAFNPLSNHYRCADDRWLLLSVGVVQDISTHRPKETFPAREAMARVRASRTGGTVTCGLPTIRRQISTRASAGRDMAKKLSRSSGSVSLSCAQSAT